MKKIKFSTSIPASLFDFSSEPNEKFSRAKLKMFYIGETPDHRLFTENFSKDLIKTLPYTPIVSQYDEEQEDFKGHATEQNIYGIVDPLGKVSFEEDKKDGKTWLICDVVLYTERKDKVGEIAKKIPGKSHSLEMDPNTVQYTVNYDNKMKIKNIEFIKGELIGASVLGDNQKPAFSGSTFFTDDSDFQNKMQILKDYCLSKKEERGINMEGTILNFVELSWGEKTKAVFQALEQRYGEFCVYPIDWFDTSVVAYIYYPSTEDTLLTRVFYSFDENGNVELGDAEQVRIAYENVSKATDAEVVVAEEQAQAEEVPQQEEVAQTEEVAQAEQVVSEQSEISEATEEQEDVVDAKCDDDEKDKEGKCGEIVDSEDKSEEDEKKDEEEDKKDEEDLSLNDASEPELESNTSIENSTLENNDEGVNITNNEETTNASTFTDSERQEFEALKTEKKVNILNSYKDALPEDILKSFEEQLDTISIEDLDASLAKEFRRVSVENSSNKKRSMRTFTLTTREVRETRESHLADLVNKYKTK